jgi:hypothetical protein
MLNSIANEMKIALFIIPGDFSEYQISETRQAYFGELQPG